MTDSRYFVCYAEDRNERKQVWNLLRNIYPASFFDTERYQMHEKKALANSCILYARNDKNIAGFVSFYCNDFKTHITYITQIAVVEEYRRNGIAAMLLDACKKHSIELGMSAIRLEVQNDNQNAIALYQKYGFEVEKKALDNSKFMIKRL